MESIEIGVTIFSLLWDFRLLERATFPLETQNFKQTNCKIFFYGKPQQIMYGDQASYEHKKVVLCLSKKNMFIDSVCARSLNKAVTWYP